MAWFKRTEKRSGEDMKPHKNVETSACDEVAGGLGLLAKLLKLNGYGALSQSPFFAAINLISNSIAQMGWNTKTYDETEVPDNFYVNHLFDNCNQTQFMFIKSIIKDVLLFGNGFAYIQRDRTGKPKNLIYLPHGECNIVYNKITGTLFYQIPKISKSLVEPINVLHIFINSKDGINGISVLDYAYNTINLNANAEKAAQEYFSSGLLVKGILSTSSPRLTKDQRNGIRESWNESQLGNGVGIPVLEQGMTYQPISSNSRDAQLLETRLYNVTEVARWFNISPVLLGDYSKVAYNSLEESQRQFVVNCLAPYVTVMEQELNRKLIMPSDKYTYYIDIAEESIIAQDKKSQAEYLGVLIDKAIITPNEARELLGYAPIDGGDILYRPFTDINQNTINSENKVNAETDKNTKNENNEEE